MSIPETRRDLGGLVVALGPSSVPLDAPCQLAWFQTSPGLALHRAIGDDVNRGRFSTQIDDELQKRVRATVRGVGFATKTDYTLAQLTEDALESHCRAMEALYNNGEAFPPSQRKLRTGPRPG